jgi:hypothetical protein
MAVTVGVTAVVIRGRSPCSGVSRWGNAVGLGILLVAGVDDEIAVVVGTFNVSLETCNLSCSVTTPQLASIKVRTTRKRIPQYDLQTPLAFITFLNK